MSNRKTEKGMTLIETVLYIALFGLIFLSMMTFVLATAEKNRIAAERVAVQRTRIFVQEHLNEVIDDAVSIDAVGSMFDVDSGVLVVNHSAGTGTYQISDSRLVYTTGAETNPVTISDIEVTRFYLEQVLDRAGGLTGVRVTMEFVSKDNHSEDTMITSFLL